LPSRSFARNGFRETPARRLKLAEPLRTNCPGLRFRSTARFTAR
jgi:hypothetical protein